MTYRHIAIGLVLTFITGLSIWIVFSFHSTTNPQMAQKKLVPDAIMEDVVSVVLDKQGKPTMKIITPKMVHYMEDDTTQLTTPELVLYRKSPQPWYINSKHGKAIGGTDHVEFWDDVVIHHAADISNPVTLIKTTELTVFPNQKTAETAALITLNQPNLTVNAKGLHADLNTGDIKLLSQARGEYAPTH